MPSRVPNNRTPVIRPQRPSYAGMLGATIKERYDHIQSFQRVAPTVGRSNSTVTPVPPAPTSAPAPPGGSSSALSLGNIAGYDVTTAGNASAGTSGQAARADHTHALPDLTGDVTGAYTTTVVGAVQGVAWSSTAPTDAQIAVYNSSTTKWVPVSFSGDATITHAGVVTLATVNANVGTFAYPSSMSVNGKGQVTAITAGSAPLVNPMTTLGDILYENGTPAAARLAGNTSTTKNFLTQTGTGSASAAPAWGTIAGTDLPATGVKIDVSSGDTTADYLVNKLVAGTNVTITKNNAGANETLTIASTSSSTFPTSYSGGTAYTTGQVVAGSDANLYRAIASTTGNDPTTDGGTHWELFRAYSNLTVTCGTTGGTSASITGATNASPIVLTASNKFKVGDSVVVSGVGGNTAANGTWTISAVSSTTITLSGSTGNGAYTSGGTAKVTGRFTDGGCGIKTAFAFIKNATWDVQNVLVTVSCVGGAYSETSEINLTHVCGRGLLVQGDTATNTNCQISFTVNASSGFTIYGTFLGTHVGAGVLSGGINGFKLVGNGIGSSSGTGVIVFSNGFVAVGSATTISGFGNGYAVNGGAMIARSTTATACATGYQANIGSMDVASSTASSCTTGFSGLNGGFCLCSSATASSCTTGVSAAQFGRTYSASITLTGNTANYSPAPNTFGTGGSFNATSSP